MVNLNDRCFCNLTATLLVPLGRASTWCLHTKLYRFGWNTLPNNTQMKKCTDLNLGKDVFFFSSIIYHIPDSWLNLLNGYNFYFWLCDSANQQFKNIWHQIWIFVHFKKYLCLRRIFLKLLEEMLNVPKLSAVNW